MTTTSAFNLDAVLGESVPKPLTYKGETFTLPGELPADCLAPFLADELGLIDLVTAVLNELDDDEEGKAPEKDGLSEVLFKALEKQPTLPSGLYAATKEAFKRLLADTPDEQDAELTRFVALRPTVPAYIAIARGIFTEYGVALSDFFESDEPSESDGESSSPTSPTTTPEPEKETSEASGDAQVTPDSSE